MQIHLHSYGTYLHVKDQLFEIKIPQPQKNKAVIKTLAAKKVQSIWLSPHTALSTAAIALALKHHIDVIVLENNGHPLGRVWHSKLGSTTLIRKRQLEASLDQRAVRWIKKWLSQKLDNQLTFLQTLGKNRKAMREELADRSDRIADMSHKIAHAEALQVGEIAEQLRGWEGTAGRLYFEMMSKVLPESYRFAGRSYRPSKDAFNAFLNYGYGILYSRTERVLMLAGIDPYVGFLHRDDYNYRSMVYDFIEPFRTMIDFPVFRLFSAKKVKQEHWKALTNGVELTKAGKQLCVEAVNQHLEDDKIRYKNRNVSRSYIMQAEAYAFANELIGKTADLPDLLVL